MFPSRLSGSLSNLSRLHVDHRNLGRYSVEKLRHFQQYQQTASPFRVAAVLVLTPLPTLLLITAMDIVPLNDPRAGPRHNTVAFVRSAVSHILITFFTLLPMKQALSLSDRDYSFLTIALIACCTSLTIEAVCIPLAFTWRFPVPFREMIGLVIFLISICVYNFVFARHTMRRLWRRRKLQSYVPLVGVQITVFYTLLGLSVGFSYLQETAQVVTIALFPVLRFLLKHLVWKYARMLDDIATDVTVCMIEISGALYQTVCMQFVTSITLNVLIVVVDCVLAVHEMHKYVSMDYLGNNRHTLATALKIVDSYLTDVAARRMTRYAVLTQSGATESATGRETSVVAGKRSTDHHVASGFSHWRSSQQGKRRSSVESMAMIAATRGTKEPGYTDLALESKASEDQTSEQDNTTTADTPPVVQAVIEKAAATRVSIRPRRSSVAANAHSSRAYLVKPTSSVETPMIANTMAVDNAAHNFQSQRPKHLQATPPTAAGESLLQTKSAHSRRKLSRSQSTIFPSRGPSLTRSTVLPDVQDPQQLQLEGSNVDDPPIIQQKSLASLVHASSELRIRKTKTESPPVMQPRRTFRRLETLTTIDGICISRLEQVRILEQTLQLLFSSEMLIFVEYMECVIPMLYALTLGSEWALPNGKYNLVVRNMSRSSVISQMWNSLVYALLELLTLLAMYWVMRRKYGVSAMYQLAFVLERYWMTLQGKLVGSFIVVLNAVTVHQGTDFSFLAS